MLLHKLTLESFAARLKQANLVNKTDFDDELKKKNKKIASNETKNVQTNTNNYKLQKTTNI